MKATYFAFYLNTITKAVNALCGAATGADLSTGTMLKVISEMKGIEQSTADFITELELAKSAKEAVRSCKRRFIYANNYVIVHLQKIQSQGYDFSEYIEALKLESKTLKEELNSL